MLVIKKRDLEFRGNALAESLSKYLAFVPDIVKDGQNWYRIGKGDNICVLRKCTKSGRKTKLVADECRNEE